VSSVTFDPVLCNNDATDVNALIEQAQLSVTKTDSTAAIDQYDTSTRAYTITYWNHGPSTARDVMLTDRWPSWLVQYINGISASNGTTCVSTGGDFTCSSGDLAVGHSVTITVPYSLAPGSSCGVVTNRVSVYSPTDSECRDAEDNTTVNCVSRTQVCRNCIDYAITSGICTAQYAACSQTQPCATCIASILADPRNPAAVCFQDAQSCALMQCTYNNACGLGAPPDVINRACDSPNNGPVLCPPTKRNALEETPLITHLAPVKPAAAAPTPTGPMLAPKQLSVQAKFVETSLEVKLSNLLKTDVQIQHLELTLVDRAGLSHTVQLDATSALVTQTTCNLAQVKLQKNWSYSCTITLHDLFSLADSASIKVVGRGFAETAKGYHPVIGVVKL